jgi:hypothetical protein
MKTKKFCLLTSIAGSVGVVAKTSSSSPANEPANDWKPATSNQQGKPYLWVNSERHVFAHIIS